MPPTATMRAARLQDILTVDPSAAGDRGADEPGSAPATGPTRTGRGLTCKAGDDDGAANHGALAGLTAIAPDDDALMPPASHDAPDPRCDVRPDPQ